MRRCEFRRVAVYVGRSSFSYTFRPRFFEPLESFAEASRPSRRRLTFIFVPFFGPPPCLARSNFIGKSEAEAGAELNAASCPRRAERIDVFFPEPIVRAESRRRQREWINTQSATPPSSSPAGIYWSCHLIIREDSGDLRGFFFGLRRSDAREVKFRINSSESHVRWFRGIR